MFLKNSCKIDKILTHLITLLIYSSSIFIDGREVQQVLPTWGNGRDLIFERDMDQLSELLERPHPEFFGAQLNDQGGEDLQWLIVASLRGKIEPPTAEGIQFTLRENNWLDGLGLLHR